MLSRISLVAFLLIIFILPVNAKTNAETEKHFYTPSSCPIELKSVESRWQDYRAPRYNKYGNRLKKELLPGIWCKVSFELPGEKEGGKAILGITFGLWYFNAFDELLGVYTAYSTESPYKPGKSYHSEWLTRDEGLGPTHQRTIIFPYQIRFADKEWWDADLKEIFEWFVETTDWSDLKFEDLFPNDIFREEEEEEENSE